MFSEIFETICLSLCFTFRAAPKAALFSCPFSCPSRAIPDDMESFCRIRFFVRIKAFGAEHTQMYGQAESRRSWRKIIRPKGLAGAGRLLCRAAWPYACSYDTRRPSRIRLSRDQQNCFHFIRICSKALKRSRQERRKPGRRQAFFCRNACFMAFLPPEFCGLTLS
jgi:hypothetical protein